MVERSTIVSPFFRDLYDQLVPDIDRRIIELANGSAKQIVGSPETVAESYARQCGYIQAMSRVIEICAELEHNIHGNRPEEQQPQSQE